MLSVCVLVPYKITLLSNKTTAKATIVAVLVPYKITLLSNVHHCRNAEFDVLVPYKITLLSNPPPILPATSLSFSTL